MPTYILLGKYTEQGNRTIREARQRQQVTRELAERLGGRLVSVQVTQGHYDVVLTVDLPDDPTAKAFLFGLGEQGNLHIEPLRAFSPEEVEQVWAKFERA
jgi:uncharacterized protein with GYD domain